MRYRQVGMALVGAVIGAGFASGREVMRFFTQYGAWGYAGVVLAAVGMGVLAARVMRVASDCGALSFGELCTCLLGRKGGSAGTALFAALLAMTCAAMLSGSGELASLVLPIGSAYWVGYGMMLIAALLVAWRGMRGLALCGSVLIPLCCLLYLPLAALPTAEPGIVLPPEPAPWTALPLALSYAALNIALSAGLLCESGQGLARGDQRRAAMLGAGCVGLLLLLANAALSRSAHQVRTAVLPMVIVASRFGKAGFYLSAATIGMAMLTTLATALRSLYLQMPSRWSARRRWACVSAVCAALGLLGFEQLIGVAYPVLGWCAAALIVALCTRQSAGICA